MRSPGKLVSKVAVSIHAPVKGATRHGLGRGRGRPVSIHAPVKGATVDDEVRSLWEEFQSTPP